MTITSSDVDLQKDLSLEAETNDPYTSTKSVDSDDVKDLSTEQYRKIQRKIGQ